MPPPPPATTPERGGGPAPYRLLGISGSLRANAYSTAVLAAFAAATVADAAFAFADIGALPHFDEDLYVDPLPGAVARFRAQVEACDGIVVASSEYNHGVPGVLKNAIDWASRPHNESPLRGKPVLIATSSIAFTGGVRAQYQLREAFVSTLARPVATPEIVIGTVAAKIVGGRFDDPATIAVALAGFAALYTEIDRNRAVRPRSGGR